MTQRTLVGKSVLVDKTEIDLRQSRVKDKEQSQVFQFTIESSQ